MLQSRSICCFSWANFPLIAYTHTILLVIIVLYNKWRNNKNLCFAACWPWYLSCRGSNSSLQRPESWWRDPWPTENPSNCIVCCWSLCLYLCILWMLWSTAREPLHGLHSECYSYNYACKLIKTIISYVQY